MQENALPGQIQIQFAPLNPPAVVLSQEEQDKLDDLIKHQKVQAYKAAIAHGDTMEEAEKAAEASGDLASQQADDGSVWAFYRDLLELRSKDPQTWVFGAYEDLLPEHPHLFVYQRGARGLVCVNLSGGTCPLPQAITQLLSERTCLNSSGEASTTQMGPWSTQIWA
jgi:hypothetical protein